MDVTSCIHSSDAHSGHMHSHTQQHMHTWHNVSKYVQIMGNEQIIQLESYEDKQYNVCIGMLRILNCTACIQKVTFFPNQLQLIDREIRPDFF